MNLHVYTDGACSNNGKPNAVGGIGIYFDLENIDNENDSLTTNVETYKTHIAESLDGFTFRPTNQRAELMAICRALQYCYYYIVEHLNQQQKDHTNQKQKHTITIYTDSKYALLGLTQWITKWIDNDWTTSQNTPVKNKDLWTQTLDELVRIQRCAIIQIKKVKGHSDCEGNKIADQLAKEGAIEAQKLFNLF